MYATGAESTLATFLRNIDVQNVALNLQFIVVSFMACKISGEKIAHPRSGESMLLSALLFEPITSFGQRSGAGRKLQRPYLVACVCVKGSVVHSFL